MMKSVSRRRRRSTVLPTVPREYGGKWVAWTKDATRIVAAGKTPQEARKAAERTGVKDIAYEWVPPADERFIGSGARR